MKKTTALSIVYVANWILPFVFTTVIAQTPGEWTWMKGSSTAGSLGVYGTQGVSNSANTPPALYEPCEWKDNNGNFWLFGGVVTDMSGTSIYYSALWKYNVATNQWTWMKGSSSVNQPAVYGVKGVPAAANEPGARGYAIASWTDASGDLWLFGGNTIGSLYLNDLWKYNIATNQWTWMHGSNVTMTASSLGTIGVPSSTNVPGARDEMTGLGTDIAGNLWLFSGKSSDGDNDNIWKYDVATNEWTWMKGIGTGTAVAVYGTQGVAAAANTPARRYPYASWVDLAGDLWFFGGGGGPGFGFTRYSDLWRYNIALNQWTWMKGPNVGGDPGSYGTKCVSATTNNPPSRLENRARVRDVCGNFWNFGGLANSGDLNDLWYYNVSSNQWTWVSGDNIVNQAAVYGIQGVSTPSNKPGAREGGVAWIDNNGYIYIFGGMGRNQPTLGNRYYNDLFRYVPPRSFIQSKNNATTCSPCNGSATINFTCALANYSYVWSTGNSTLNTTSNSNTINGLCPGSYTVTATSNCNQTQTTTFTITGTVCGGITANVNSAVLCSGATPCPSLTATGANGTAPYTYLWSTSATTASINPCPASTTTYTITVTDNAGSTVTSTATITVNPAVNVTITPTNISCNGGTTGNILVSPLNGTSPYVYSWSNGQVTQTATGLSAGSYTVIVTDAKGCTATTAATIISPPPFIGQFTKGTANCTSCGCKEWIMVTATGGTSPYSYMWPDGYNNRYKNQLCPGNYSINIKDKNGCSINVNLSTP